MINAHLERAILRTVAAARRPISEGQLPDIMLGLEGIGSDTFASSRGTSLSAMPRETDVMALLRKFREVHEAYLEATFASEVAPEATTPGGRVARHAPGMQWVLRRRAARKVAYRIRLTLRLNGEAVEANVRRGTEYLLKKNEVESGLRAVFETLGAALFEGLGRFLQPRVLGVPDADIWNELAAVANGDISSVRRAVVEEAPSTLVGASVARTS